MDIQSRLSEIDLALSGLRLKFDVLTAEARHLNVLRQAGQTDTERCDNILPFTQPPKDVA